MDLATLRARLEQLVEKEVRDFSALQDANGALKRAQFAARAENDDRKARGLLATFDAGSIRYEHIEATYPHLPQEGVERLQSALTAVDGAKRRLEKTSAARQAAQKELDARLEEFTREALAETREGVVHWDRRFHTSLAIGHGAAFAAIVNHVFDKDTSQAAIRAGTAPLAIFAIGLLASGAIPWVLAKEVRPDSSVAALAQAASSRSKARNLARVSAGLFIAGVLASVGGTIFLGWGVNAEADKIKMPAKLAPAEQTEPGSPSTSLSVAEGRSRTPSEPPGKQAPAPLEQPQSVKSPPATDRKGDHK